MVEVSVPLASENRPVPPVIVTTLVVVWAAVGRPGVANVKVPVSSSPFAATIVWVPLPTVPPGVIATVPSKLEVYFPRCAATHVSSPVRPSV